MVLVQVCNNSLIPQKDWKMRKQTQQQQKPAEFKMDNDIFHLPEPSAACIPGTTLPLLSHSPDPAPRDEEHCRGPLHREHKWT